MQRGALVDQCLVMSICLVIGPAPINSEKRPQADTSLSRPVWPQFCFYPLRIIPQGTQSQGLRMWSVFGGVENSMFLGLC